MKTKKQDSPESAKTRAPRPRHEEPHSAWQVLVHLTMREKEMSIRQLADALSTSKSAISHATLWMWTLNIEGGPPRKRYTDEMNQRFAKALNLRPQSLAQAYEESRRVLNLPETGRSHAGKLGVLRKLIATSTQKTWTSDELVNLIDDLES